MVALSSARTNSRLVGPLKGVGGLSRFTDEAFGLRTIDGIGHRKRSRTDEMETMGNRNASYVVSKMFTNSSTEWMETRHGDCDPFLSRRLTFDR